MMMSNKQKQRNQTRPYGTFPEDTPAALEDTAAAPEAPAVKPARRSLFCRNNQRILFLIVAELLLVGMVFEARYTVGAAVRYDGQMVAAVATVEEVETVCADLEDVTSQALHTDYTIDPNRLECQTCLMKRDNMVDAKALSLGLTSQIGLIEEADALYVDGELVGAVEQEGAIEALLDTIKAAASDSNTVSCDFQETVEIKHEYVPVSALTSVQSLNTLLSSMRAEEVTYTVVSGDTWSEIAENHGTTSAAMLAMNPGYDIDRIHAGDVLTLSTAVPYLTTIVKERECYLSTIPYEIAYTDTDSLYVGDYEVVSEGAEGAADVLANVTYVNGVETERTVLSSVMLSSPVTEQQLRGTQERPTWQATGSFRWPCSGNLTSRFGGRSSPGGIGSTNHKGIDIANSYGTAVCAADGGTVIYAGWMSGYGYLVQIDHDNGYVTYYAHNSSLAVSVGEHVYKGQQIACMGATGNATGNHCHFEIRYNGTAQDPLNYL